MVVALVHSSAWKCLVVCGSAWCMVCIYSSTASLLSILLLLFNPSLFSPILPGILLHSTVILLSYSLNLSLFYQGHSTVSSTAISFFCNSTRSIGTVEIREDQINVNA